MTWDEAKHRRDGPVGSRPRASSPHNHSPAEPRCLNLNLAFQIVIKA